MLATGQPFEYETGLLKVEYHLHGERTLYCNNPREAPQSVCSCERYKDNDLPWRRNLATGKSVQDLKLISPKFG